MGADGCLGGWLAVSVRDGARSGATARIVPPAEELLEEGACVAIDMPIGLVDTPADGPRAADRAARAFLAAHNHDAVRGPGARVFASPTRAHLALIAAGASYAALRARFPKGQSISKQCFHICPKILELDALCRRRPEAALWEAHPEVTFASLAGRTLAPKKSRAGAAQREQLLGALGFDLESLTRQLPARRALWAKDDLYDACVLTVTAERVALGAQGTLPVPPERDGFGLRRAIHF
ncbi:MAG: DUF429 domain-containing protein [Pseudomonadota bacterium]